MKAIKIIVTLLSLFFVISCDSRKMNTTDLFENQNSFELTIWDESNPKDTTYIKSIRPDSEIITKLKDWIAENSWGWLESPITYDNPNALLKGSNFNFKIYNSFVVISYKDTKGNVRQFFKDVDSMYFYFITFKKKKPKNRDMEFDLPYYEGMH